MSNATPHSSCAPSARSELEATHLLEVGLDQPAPPPSQPLSEERLQACFPDLEFMNMLGLGGMGSVYLVRQRQLDRNVALKLLRADLAVDPEFTERFTREARALAKLQHPHIVQIYEFGEKEGLYFLLMEHVDGVTLRELMNAKSVSPHEALEIVPQICAALQYAHDQGVVHRDIKPENIMLDRGGRIKVTDFGLATLATDDNNVTLTGTGHVMGTRHYMAPEQTKTPSDVDHRADIFSLGVVFYEMLTGELPMGRFEQPSSAAGLDQRIDAIVMRTLERERTRRYQRAGDVKNDVETVVNSASESVRTNRTPHSTTPSRSKDLLPLSKWTIASGLLLLLALFVPGPITHQLLNDDAPNSLRGILLFLTAAGCGLIVTVVAARAAFATRPSAQRFRGHYRSIGILVLSIAWSLLSFAMAMMVTTESQESWNSNGKETGSKSTSTRVVSSDRETEAREAQTPQENTTPSADKSKQSEFQSMRFPQVAFSEEEFSMLSEIRIPLERYSQLLQQIRKLQASEIKDDVGNAKAIVLELRRNSGAVRSQTRYRRIMMERTDLGLSSKEHELWPNIAFPIKVYRFRRNKLGDRAYIHLATTDNNRPEMFEFVKDKDLWRFGAGPLDLDAARTPKRPR